jgi:hypothetical protein
MISTISVGQLMAPIGLMPPPLAAPFVAQWDSILYAPQYGTYEFTLQASAGAALWLDHQRVISDSAQLPVQLTLAADPHDLRLQATSGAEPVQLTWRQPESTEALAAGAPEPIPTRLLFQSDLVPAQGLLSTYCNGETAAAPPAFSRIDSSIDMYAHLIPLPRPNTVEWTGQIDIPTSGTWTFGLVLNGEAELWIDDQPMVQAATTNGLTEGPINLTAGQHRVRLHFLDNHEGSFIHLYWKSPVGERQMVPITALKPLP